MSLALGLWCAGWLAWPVAAQTFTTLHSFALIPNSPPFTNSEGAAPYAGVILSTNTLFGTTFYGGSSGKGTVFRVNVDGSGFTNLHSFNGTSDGAPPYAGLVLAGNTLYGTARFGGSANDGTVFALNTDGTGFTNLHDFTIMSSFTNGDGSTPDSGVILNGNRLYGTTEQGGLAGNGVVFAMNTDGSGFTNLHSFSARLSLSFTNVDGAFPYAGLTLANGVLYGTAHAGGAANNGTVFALATNGSGFTNLHSFTAAKYSSVLNANTNSDGIGPVAGLIFSDGRLFGAAQSGGSGNSGTVFAVNTNGTGFTNLHVFTTTHYPHSNNDGAQPDGVLTLVGNALYGMTYYGGSLSSGVMFKVYTDGSGFATPYVFTSGNDGGNPPAGLVMSGVGLYGTATYGGASGNGTVFSLSFAPPLAITVSGTNTILTWPTNMAGFDYSEFALQSSPNLGGAANWNAVSPSPVVVNGQNTVTNALVGSPQFYRLSQ